MSGIFVTRAVPCTFIFSCYRLHHHARGYLEHALGTGVPLGQPKPVLYILEQEKRTPINEALERGTSVSHIPLNILKSIPYPYYEHTCNTK